jgi:McrBC 5-methylcytosine restriction system component
MLLIKLSDNNYNGYKLSLTEYSKEEKETIRNALDSINNISLSELEERGAIIFPSKTVRKDLDDKKRSILSVQHLTTDTPTITTRNVMGFFSVKGVQFEISSRFDSGEKQFFLHYMLSKVCNVAPTIELTHANKDPLYDFAVYLFPAFLKKAVSLGLFRMYITREYNDSNLRGVIDFPRHFRNNIPFNGKIAYRTREYSSDNFVTQLVRHTIEFIAENSSLRKILSLDDETRGAVQEICGNTGSYDRLSRNFIINKNLRPLSHPYYTEYEQLRKLCIMILTHDKVSYGESQQNQINGILFDGASLWEDYLNAAMQEQIGDKFELEHPNNRTGQGKKWLFEKEAGGKSAAIYPDFILKEKDSNKITAIMDAKYKHLEGATVQREDYFQLLAYMFRFNSNRGMLIYPYGKNEKEPESKLFLKDHENKVTLSVLGLEIPQECGSFSDFIKQMEEIESNFAKQIAKTEIL